MMMLFGFCMYCLWEEQELLTTPSTLQSPHTTHLHIYISTHTTHLHILMISSLVLTAIPVVTVCTDIHSHMTLTLTISGRSTRTILLRLLMLRWGPYTVREMSWEVTVFPDWTLTLIWRSISVQRLRRSPSLVRSYTCAWGGRVHGHVTLLYLIRVYITINNSICIIMHVHTINLFYSTPQVMYTWVETMETIHGWTFRA